MLTAAVPALSWQVIAAAIRASYRRHRWSGYSTLVTGTEAVKGDKLPVAFQPFRIDPDGR